MPRLGRQARAMFIMRRVVNERQWGSTLTRSFEEALQAEAIKRGRWACLGGWPLNWKGLSTTFGSRAAAIRLILKYEPRLPVGFLARKADLSPRAFRVRVVGWDGPAIYPGDSPERARTLAIQDAASRGRPVTPDRVKVSRSPCYDSWIQLHGVRPGSLNRCWGIAEWCLSDWKGPKRVEPGSISGHTGLPITAPQPIRERKRRYPTEWRPREPLALPPW